MMTSHYIAPPWEGESAQQSQARQLQHAPGLSDWERQFCFGIRTQSTPLSPKQSHILSRIAAKMGGYPSTTTLADRVRRRFDQD